MSKVQNPIIGRSAGKLANVVFATWKGINTVRSKALTVANPQSPAQTAQREKFSAAVDYGRQILGFLQMSFKSLAVGRSEFNVFVSKITNKIDPTTKKVDSGQVTNLEFSSGSLQQGLGMGITGTLGTGFTVTWNTTGYYPQTSDTDTLSIVAYNDSQNYIEANSYAATRGDGTTNITLAGQAASGNQVYFYACFQNAKGEFSNSQYIGTLTI